MDENRLEGNVRNVGGKFQEGVGRATGDTKSKVEGVMIFYRKTMLACGGAIHRRFI